MVPPRPARASAALAAAGIVEAGAGSALAPPPTPAPDEAATGPDAPGPVAEALDLALDPVGSLADEEGAAPGEGDGPAGPGAASGLAGLASSGPPASFLDRAEARAERAIAWARLLVAGLLALVVFGGREAAEAAGAAAAGPSPLIASLLVLGMAATSGAAFLALRLGLYRPRYGTLFAGADVALALLVLGLAARRYGLSGNHLFLSPASYLGTLVVALNALRYRPAVVLAAVATYVAGAAALALWLGLGAAAPPLPAGAGAQADALANVARLAAVALTGGVLVLVVLRGRRLLLRALSEGRERLALTRFLPASVADDLADPSSALAKGTTLDVVVMFADLRGSSGIAERMGPERVADFLTRFRRRIARAVEAHGGLVDKFAGDGALIVFGVPRPRPDDGARALACARDLVAAIDDWNRTRDRRSALSIVVGLHAGPCFCGVVGDEGRLEFTVIGDAVNAAARLEALAKERDEELVASREALARAGVDPAAQGWRALGPVTLRGRRAAVEVFAHGEAPAEGEREDGAPALAVAPGGPRR